MNYINTLPPLSTVIVLQGYNFNYTQYVFLSASDNTTLPSVSAVDLFSNIASVSTNNPPFTGYQITTYDITNNNIIKITLVDIYGPSALDIIVVNAAGYTKLSTEGYLVSAMPPLPPAPLNILEFNGVLNLFNDNNLEVIL
jgi:hypothetical protein